MKKILIIIPILYLAIQDQMNVEVRLETKDTVYISTSWRHMCNWQACGFCNKAILTGPYPFDSRKRWFEELHFYNPSLQRKQIDSIINFKSKYISL